MSLSVQIQGVRTAIVSLLEAADGVAQGTTQLAAVRRARSLSLAGLSASPAAVCDGIARTLCPHVLNLASLTQQRDQKSTKAYLTTQLTQPIPADVSNRDLCETMMAIVLTHLSKNYIGYIFLHLCYIWVSEIEVVGFCHFWIIVHYLFPSTFKL